MVASDDLLTEMINDED